MSDFLLTTMTDIHSLKPEEKKWKTDFTGDDLYRLLCLWVYDLSKADPQLGYNNGEGLVVDTRKDRPGVGDEQTGVNAQYKKTLFLIYGSQETRWHEMLKRVAHLLRCGYERKVYISMNCNPEDGCNLCMTFSWNMADLTTKPPAIVHTSLNGCVCNDILYALDRHVSRTTPLMHNAECEHERKVYISMNCNPEDECNLCMTFSRNTTDLTTEPPAIVHTSLNGRVCNDILYASDRRVSSTTPLMHITEVD